MVQNRETKFENGFIKIEHLDTGLITYSQLLSMSVTYEQLEEYINQIKLSITDEMRYKGWHQFHDFSVVKDYTPLATTYMSEFSKWADKNGRICGIIILPKHGIRTLHLRTANVIMSLLKWGSKTTSTENIHFVECFEEGYQRIIDWEEMVNN